MVDYKTPELDLISVIQELSNGLIVPKRSVELRQNIFSALQNHLVNDALTIVIDFSSESTFDRKTIDNITKHLQLNKQVLQENDYIFLHLVRYMMHICYTLGLDIREDMPKQKEFGGKEKEFPKCFEDMIGGHIYDQETAEEIKNKQPDMIFAELTRNIYSKYICCRMYDRCKIFKRWLRTEHGMPCHRVCECKAVPQMVNLFKMVELCKIPVAISSQDDCFEDCITKLRYKAESTIVDYNNVIIVPNGFTTGEIEAYGVGKYDDVWIKTFPKKYPQPFNKHLFTGDFNDCDYFLKKFNGYSSVNYIFIVMTKPLETLREEDDGDY